MNHLGMTSVGMGGSGNGRNLAHFFILRALAVPMNVCE